MKKIICCRTCAFIELVDNEPFFCPEWGMTITAFDSPCSRGKSRLTYKDVISGSAPLNTYYSASGIDELPEVIARREHVCPECGESFLSEKQNSTKLQFCCAECLDKYWSDTEGKDPYFGQMLADGLDLLELNLLDED